MRRKQIQLWLTQNGKEIRHWLVIVIGGILLVFSMITYSGQNRLIKQVAVLSEQNKVLSEQNKQLNSQGKKLAEETQVIAKQNRDYARCIAIILGTTDLPTTITNLDTCTFNGKPRAANGTAGSSTTQSSTTINNPTTEGAAPSTSTPSTTTQPPPPKPLDCKVDLFGLHIGC